MPQIIVHAGLPKTATTTIQAALYENHEELLRHGVLYPSVAKLHTLQLISMFKDRPLNHRLLRDKSDAELDQYSMDSRNAIEAQFGTPDLQQIVMSSEGLVHFKRHEFEKIRKWAQNWTDDIKVVVYLRDPIQHTVSSIQQCVKVGIPFDNMINKLHGFIIRCDRVLAHLFEVFGKENVIVREFEGVKDEEFGLLGNFLEMIKVPQDLKMKIMSSTDRMNESLTLDAVLLLIHAQRSGKKVNLGLAREIAGRKFDLPLSLKHQIFDLSRSSVEFINSETGIDRYSYSKDTITSSVKLSDFESNGIFNLLDGLIARGFDDRRLMFSPP